MIMMSITTVCCLFVCLFVMPTNHYSVPTVTRKNNNRIDW